MVSFQKNLGPLTLAFLAAILLLPAIILGGGGRTMALTEIENTGGKEVGGSKTNTELMLVVYNEKEEKLEEMSLENYLIGVLAAEVPAHFGKEALKAQAVAARTYTLKKSALLGGEGCEKHGVVADICTDSTHCQAWLKEEEVKEKWPAEAAEQYYAKLKEAVQETAGEVLIYEGQLINAVYHANCGGHTEDAENVWVGEHSCLRGIECPYCQDSPVYSMETVFSVAEFAALFQAYPEALPVFSSSLPNLELLSFTSSGRVGKIRVGRKEYRGTDFRQLTGLPSTYFTWRLDKGKIVFENRGKGHGVGLCQYGAQGMAEQGFNYEEILTYYYQGVELSSFYEIKGSIE